MNVIFKVENSFLVKLFMHDFSIILWFYFSILCGAHRGGSQSDRPHCGHRSMYQVRIKQKQAIQNDILVFNGGYVIL